MTSFRSIFALALTSSIVAFGCTAEHGSSDETDADGDLQVDASEAALHGGYGRRVLGLRFKGLEPLGPDYVYEGWLLVDGAPVSAGRFSLTDPSRALYFSGPRSVLDRATAYILTIEPKVGDDPAPSKTHVLAGDIMRGYGYPRASLTISHKAALGTDFSTAAGSYFLQTPTSPEPDDYAQGIWFLNPGAGTPSLSLPTLPEGWVYEGWVVGADGPVSTGRFKVATGADSDGAGPAAGPNAGPPFPGQDFITPPRNLVGGKVVISVEPEMDDSPAPFAIKPLVDGEVTDVGPGVLQPLGNASAANAPRGIAVVF
ncbi:MAG: anti-sigma factor [Myxococcales bacterium]|nr:anti-sigma factor [Myxococcales bacterium]